MNEQMSDLEILLQAARDPAIDVGKLEVLSRAQEAARLEQARIAFQLALAQIAGRISPVTKAGIVGDRGSGRGYHYSKLEDIDAMLRPLMLEHGFAMSFSTAHTDMGMMVTGVLMHTSGFSRSAEVCVPSDRGHMKNELQAIGSSLYYARRYLTEMLLNLVRGGQDDDAASAYAAPALLTAEQVAQIERLIENTRTDAQRFLTTMAPYAHQISDIAARDFVRLINALQAKEARLLRERKADDKV